MRRANRATAMGFLTLYHYYRFLGMSRIDAAIHGYQLRAR